MQPWVRRRVLAAAVVLLAGCTSTPDGSPSAAEQPGEAPSSSCVAAFEAAAAVDEMSDTVQDFDPAVVACLTLAAWGAANDAVPAALDGVDPWTFLGNRCDDPAADLTETPLCQELLASCGVQPYADSVFCLIR